MIGPGGFRFLLAWMVVVEHVSRFEIGKVAVMAFFVLSGYWVTRVFDERYSKSPNGAQLFYLSRFLRIWPLYATIFVLALLVYTAMSISLPPDVWVALLIFGVAVHGIDIIGVTWSLDIELQFYLLLPVFVWLFSRSGRSVLLGVILIGWVIGLYLGKTHNLETVLIYAPLFLAGAALHLMDVKPGRSMALLSVAAFVAVGVGAAFVPALKPYVIYGSGSNFNDKMFAIFWVIFLLPFVAFNVRQASGWADRHMGNLSYTLYLVHYPLLRASEHGLGRDLYDVEKLFYFAASLFLSLLLYAALEIRYEVWRRRIVGHVQRTLSFRQTRR